MKPPSTAAFTVARYVVVTADREPMEHFTEDDALSAARRIRDGARVYLCVGEPPTDLWRKPVLVAEYGGEPSPLCRSAA